MSYPILVERFDAAHPALEVVCEVCDRGFTWNPAYGDPVDAGAACECGGQIVFKYSETDRCGVCGELDDCEHRMA